MPPSFSAEKEVAAFIPSFWDRLFREAERKKAQLQQWLAAAIEEDAAETAERWETYRETVASREAGKDLAKGVLAFEKAAFLKVIEESDATDSIPVGRGVGVSVRDDCEIAVLLDATREDEIPEEEPRALVSGRVSSRRISKSRRREIHCTHVCSSVIRIAREIFALLPVQHVYITAILSRLDPATGHSRSLTIISVRMVRGCLDGINLQQIDPMDTMTAFGANLQYLKRKGFQEVEPLVALDEEGRSVWEGLATEMGLKVGVSET